MHIEVNIESNEHNVVVEMPITLGAIEALLTEAGYDDAQTLILEQLTESKSVTDTLENLCQIKSLSATDKQKIRYLQTLPVGNPAIVGLCQGLSNLQEFRQDVTGVGDLRNGWNSCTALQVCELTNSSSISNPSGSWYMCVNLHTLRCDFAAASSASHLTWAGCSSLKICEIDNLGVDVKIQYSPYMLPSSVAYMINNSQADKTFSILLHETAKEAALADADVIAALAEHTNVTIL